MADRPIHGVASFSDRETFAVDLLTHLSDILPGAIGMEAAEDVVTAVTTRMARDVTQDIGGLPVRDRSPAETAEQLVRLMDRIGGRFEIARFSDNCVEFRGCGCPFGAKVKGRDSLCRMTCGVFGRVVAEVLGYARVTVVDSIARGSDSCRVVVDLRRVAGEEPQARAPQPVGSGLPSGAR